MEYIRDEHRVHLIVYHLVWTPKRRKAVLVGDVAVECEQIIRDCCLKRGWSVISLAVMPDHVHLFVRVWPTVSAGEVIKICKGNTARLRHKHSSLRKIPCVWTRSYFASTAGNVCEETVRHYIEAQKGK